MSTLGWIVLSGVVTSLIALVGGFTLFLSEKTLKKLLNSMVALAAGTLIGGALFHMLPTALAQSDDHVQVLIWVAVGFSTFFVLEQFLHWHHCHRVTSEHKQPLGYLILIADAVHNFVGGVGVSAAFLVDVRLGIVTWVAAIAHEIPQELGDYGVLIHGGWGRKQALLFNFLSALTFLIGGLLTYAFSREIDVSPLVPFAAGNFIYIAAADLIPEIKRHDSLAHNILHFVAFTSGLVLLAAVYFYFET